MKVRVVSDRPWDVPADVLVVPVPEGDWTDELAELDRRLEGQLGTSRRLGLLRAKRHATALLRTSGSAGAWLLTVGIGPLDAFDALAAYRYGAVAERALAGLEVGRLAVVLPGGASPSAASLAVRGVIEGSYEPATIYREAVESAPPALRELVLVAGPDADVAALGAAAANGQILGDGANRTRTLAQRAANDVSPEVLADEATAIAREAGLAIEVIGPERATELGMGMFMAIGRGSDNPPRLIVLRAGAEGSVDRHGRLLGLVGKGVTFDTGGISIKPADRMEEMKMDKTGACTVIVALATVHRLAPELPLLGLAPAVENMAGAHSTRPGDVVRALNGLWVEVNNTDAEGRLILGDAMTYAERLGATHLVDVATLTGAVARAFGESVTGGFGTPQAWWDEVAAAGAVQAERLWQVPLVDDYREDMDSWYADVRNSFGADGSLVKSGMFLDRFHTVPWVHLDIGGTAYLRHGRPWAPHGATGVTHATLVELALAGA
jgi:leucyl aminopeptidase